MVFVAAAFLGFGIALLTVSPPGLLNMTATKINLNAGRMAAFKFVQGALLIILIQTGIALVCAKYLYKNQQIMYMLREIGIGVFALMSAYFLLKKKQKKPKYLKKKWKPVSVPPLLLGLSLATLNVLPVPFYVMTSMALSHTGYFKFELGPMTCFVVGVTVGAGFVFRMYIVMFERMKDQLSWITKRMNLIIGTVLAIAALITAVQLTF
ncbi:MAG: hypothetical protein CFE24_08725 [Flavobacterium sp. BFFFF2]|nr:MAG: hypothetical protein CFE24_08725 [Flavobacterium sp. BFFFF2]